MKIEAEKSPPIAGSKHNSIARARPGGSRTLWLLLGVLTLTLSALPVRVSAQAGTIAIWGEVKINTTKSDQGAPLGATIILYKSGGSEVGRQSVSSGGRYRFTNLSSADYDIAVEMDGREVTRQRLNILNGSLPPFYGYRQDFEFDWKTNAPAANSKTEVISAADLYDRSPANRALFHKAQSAVDKKKYDQAVTLLQQIVDNDKLDFQVWTLLGTIYQLAEKPDEAEKAYLSAIQARPTFALAHLDLGKLRESEKRFDQAVEPLTRAVEIQPQSSEANLLLGEAYLQTRRGSKAVPYLTEAARLGRIEGHLRLAWLYDAAGLKEKAANEYEELLKKKPDYPDRKKLEQYIRANKKT